ncbi:DUF5663 domain-containing protein [Kocuria sp. CPCC 205268]|uniref:DUF5663 domain-containing protein n=1 Tax=Kocuria oxytropis TaxID=3058913 RepID=UPI0034D71BBC
MATSEPQKVGFAEDLVAVATGAGLSLEEAGSLVVIAEQELELRVGVRLADGLTHEQLEEFAELVEAPGNHAGAVRWLEINVPDYSQVVREEIGAVLAQTRRILARQEV